MKVSWSVVRHFGPSRCSLIIRRTASSSTSSASLYQATMCALRRNAIANDSKTKLGPVRQAARRHPTGNHNHGQNGSGGSRRLHPVALLCTIVAGGYLTVLYIHLGLEMKLKELQDEGTAVSLDQFIEKFLAVGAVGLILYVPKQRLAVAALQPGFPHPHVFVHFDVPHASAPEFRRRIGEAEDEHRIPLAHREPIIEYAAISNVELTIGVISACVIIFLLVRPFGRPALVRPVCRERPGRK